MQYSEKLTVDCHSKQFWKTCKQYFSNKNSYIQENIMLLEKDKLLSKQTDVAAILNKHFGSITDSLNLFSWPENTSMSSGNDTINSISNRSMCKWNIKALKTGSFPDSLKCANVRPIYKKVDPFDKNQWAY